MQGALTLQMSGHATGVLLRSKMSLLLVLTVLSVIAFQWQSLQVQNSHAIAS